MAPTSCEDRQADDSGQMVVLVLLVSVMLIASLAVALTFAQSGLNFATRFATSLQGKMAAQTGLATELTAMRGTSSAANLPCSLTGSLGVKGATSTYSVSVAYFSGSTVLTCAGSTLGGSTSPTSATLTSVGKAPHGSEAIMREDAAIAASASTSAALGYAIFTPNSLDLTGAATLQTGTSVPDVYAGQQLTCANGTTSTGNVVTYYAVDFTGSCSFSGNLTDASDVKLENSANVGGNVISYGGNTSSTSCDQVNTGTKKNPVYTYYAICLSGSATIGKNATETAGNIEVPNGTIKGNAYAWGTISVSGGGAITGTQNPGDLSLSSQTMPPADPFPSLTLPTTGWNVVSIPSSQCATYFQSINNEASGTSVANPDPFQAALENQTQKTIYEAPNCGTPASPVTYSNAQVFALNPSPAGDAILDIGAVAFQNSNTFCEESATDSHTCSSATTPGPNLTFLAGPTPPAPPASPTCSTSSVDISFSNYSNFEPNVAVLIYSLGEVDYANAPSMTGQILACGGMTGTNAFTLTFNPSAADEVFGTSGSPMTVSVEDKYFVSG